MINSDDKLLASSYLDGELEAIDREKLEKRLQNEPDLQKYLEKISSNDRAMQQVFNEINSKPIPGAITKILGDSQHGEEETVLAGKTAKFRKSKDPMHSFQYWPTAIAASVALIIGMYIGSPIDQPRIVSQGELLTSAYEPTAELGEALSTLNSGSTLAIDKHILLPEFSFRRRDGALCRQYLLRRSSTGFRGIACMQNAQWSNVLLAPSMNIRRDNTEYLPAAAEDTSAIATYLKQQMSGIPLTGIEENAELDISGTGIRSSDR